MGHPLTGRSLPSVRERLSIEILCGTPGRKHCVAPDEMPLAWKPVSPVYNRGCVGECFKWSAAQKRAI